MKLDDAITLFQNGEIEESQTLISKLLDTSDISSEEYLELKLLQSELLYLKENYLASLNELDLLLAIPKLSEFDIIKMKAILAKSEILYHLSKVNESFMLFQEVELSFEQINQNFGEKSRLLQIRLWRVKGVFLQFYGKHDEAEEAYVTSQNLAQDIGYGFELSLTLNLLGLFNLNNGRIDVSKRFLDKSHQLREELKNEYLLVRSYNSLGTFYQVKGDLDSALENFEN
ncbi:MAG: hypothetical protein ACC656_08115, partial [Candidatus Heimdallarchaeota archaeon]